MRKALASAGFTAVGAAFRRPAMLLPVPLLTLAVLWAGHHLWVVLGVVAAQMGWLFLGAREASRASAIVAHVGYPRITDIETVERLLPTGADEEGGGTRGAALVIRLDEGAAVTR